MTSEDKQKVKDYFEQHHGENIYPSDIFEDLDMDYDLVWEICKELESEGKIKAVVL